MTGGEREVKRSARSAKHLLFGEQRTPASRKGLSVCPSKNRGKSFSLLQILSLWPKPLALRARKILAFILTGSERMRIYELSSCRTPPKNELSVPRRLGTCLRFAPALRLARPRRSRPRPVASHLDLFCARNLFLNGMGDGAGDIAVAS